MTRLRSHRLARGWTLRQAADFFHEMCGQEGLTGPRLDADQLSVWEKDFSRRPRGSTIELLCRLYATDPRGLGFEGPNHPETQAPPAATRVQGAYPILPPSPAALGSEDGLAALAEQARRTVDRTLASASVTQGQLDLMDERLLWLSQQYVYMPPAVMIGDLLQELSEVQTLSSERQPAAIQVRLSEVTALIATLVADALMKMGRLRESHAWYATARTAADDSGSTDVRARVRAQAAMLPYYYGSIETAVSLAREARLLTANRSTPTAALAAAAEARALARQGKAAAAQRAINRAQTTFEACESSTADDAFAFPERRFLLYLSGAYTFLGLGTQARHAQRQALSLYPTKTGIDPALLRLEEAICLSQERSLTEACQLAQATFLEVPDGHRTDILGARAQQVLDVLPPAMRASRSARELTEALSNSAGRK